MSLKNSVALVGVKSFESLTIIQKHKSVEKVLDEEIRPLLKRDGGDVELVNVTEDEFSLIDNAVAHALSGFDPAVYTFSREELGASKVIYSIFDDIGELGRVSIIPDPWGNLNVQYRISGDTLEESERGHRFRIACDRVINRIKFWSYAQREFTPAEDTKSKRHGGPTARTQERACVFKRLKDENPTWSQARLAMEARPELEEVVTADTVRNTYRAMGWKWERADRIR